MSGATMNIRGAVRLSATLLSMPACVVQPDRDDVPGATTADPSASETGAANGSATTGETGAADATSVTTADHPTGGATSGDPSGAESDSSGMSDAGNTVGDITGDDTTGGDTTVGESTGTTGGEWQWGGCEPVWPQTGPVSGMTPVGELAFAYAAFDADGCGPIELISLILFPAMPVFDEDLELFPNPYRLDVSLTGDGWYGNWVREGPVHVTLVDENQQAVAAADGTLKITMLDIEDTSFMGDGGLSHWLVGSLVVDAPGWALQGEFTAALCWMYQGAILCP